MFDPFLVSLICLVLFAPGVINLQAVPRGWWLGLTFFALFSCWLIAGWGAAAAVILLSALVSGLFNTTQTPLQRIFPQVMIWLIGLLIAALVLAIFNVAVPLSPVAGETLIPVSVALAAAWLVTLPFNRAKRTREALATEAGLVLLAGAVAVTVDDLAVLLLIFGLVGLVTLYHRQLAQTRLALAQREKENLLLNSVGNFTASTLNLDDVLWNIYLHVSRLMDISAFYIALYDSDRDLIEFRLVVHNGKRVEWPPRRFAGRTTEYVIQRGEVQLIKESDRKAIPELRDFSPHIAYRAFLGIPLRVDTEVLGVMAVLSTDHEDAFGAHEVGTLQTVASQVALVVRHALLFTAEAELVGKLSKLNAAVEEMLFHGNRESVLDVACKTVLAVSGGQQIAFALTSNGTFQLECKRGLSEAHHDYIKQRLTLDLPLALHIVTAISDGDAPELLALRQNAGTQALIEVPMRAGARQQGLLFVFYDAPYFFRQRELDLMETLVNHISIMLENARLFDVMENYAYEMSELVQLSRISTSSMDVDKVMYDVAEMLKQMSEVNRVAIISLDDHQQRVLAVAGNGHASNDELDILKPFRELPELSPEAPSAYQRDDVGLVPALRQQMIEHEEQTIAIIPLTFEATRLGVVLLGSHKPRHFQEHEWQFIEMATNQIAAQLNNVRLYQRTQQELNRRLEQVSIIEEIAQQVSSSLDFNLIIDHVLDAALRATGAGLASLGLVTEAKQFWIIEQRLQDGKPQKRHFSLPRSTGVIAHVVETKEIALIPNNDDFKHYTSDYAGVYRSSLAVPLLNDEEVVGVLNVESTQPNAFSKGHANFLVNLAGHAVVSIENARFLEARQYEIDMLKSLRDLSLWLVSADDTPSVGHEILETALQLLDGRNGILYKYHPASKQLKEVVRLWYSEQDDSQVNEALPEMIALEAAQSAHYVFVDDIPGYSTYTGPVPADYRCVLAFPLRLADQTPYLILMTFEGRRSLIDRDLHTIDLLSSQAIGHLENASLHERIRWGRDQMRAILNSTQDGMVLLDSEARLVEANASASDLLGINFADHIGHALPDIFDDIAERDVNEGYTRHEIEQLLTTLRQKPEAETRREFQHYVNAQVRYLEELGLPVRDDEDHIIGRLLVLRDVTESKLLDEQREDFADMVVHDLRGPLGGIINALTLALPMLGIPEDTPDAETLLQGAITSSSRLLVLVNTLLDISKMQRPGLELDCEPVSVAALAETAFMTLVTPLMQAKIDVDFDLPADLPFVYVDREKLERVFINLLDNAMRYSPAGGQIKIKSRAGDDRVEVRIIDSGPGIPPERRDQIFDRFQRIPGRDPLRGHRGHGLGLTFTRLAIEAHGGTIHIADDDELSGACFVFTLPIVK